MNIDLPVFAFVGRQSSDRKETVALKKFLKCFLVLAAVGTAIGLIIAYFCKGNCSDDNCLAGDDSDFTEDEDFDLDIDLKPVSDREYVSLQKNEKENTEEASKEKESDTQKEV